MKIIAVASIIVAAVAGLSVAHAAGQSYKGGGKVCMEETPGGMFYDCKYASLQACMKLAQANGLQCQPNPKRSTTGMKAK